MKPFRLAAPTKALDYYACHVLGPKAPGHRFLCEQHYLLANRTVHYFEALRCEEGAFAAAPAVARRLQVSAQRPLQVKRSGTEQQRGCGKRWFM